MTAEGITLRQQEIKKSTSEVLGVDPETAQMLLISFRWNKELLMEKFMDSPEQVQIDAGIVLSPIRDLPKSTFECEICCTEYPPIQAVSLGCGHVFCCGCIKAHLEFAVQQGLLKLPQTGLYEPNALGPSCTATTCPRAGCKARYPESMFVRFLSGLSLFEHSKKNTILYLR